MLKFIFFVIISLFGCISKCHTNYHYLTLPFHNQNEKVLQPPTLVPPRTRLNPIASHISQNLDNFNPQNLEKFNQRYFHIGQFYKSGGPIFIFVGNQQKFTDTGEEFDYYLICDIASKLNGQVFFLEHRYYGKSQPFRNLTTENLRYLTIDQALADLAYFISYVKSKYIPNDIKYTPVILVGYQYGGGLVTWFRQKYSHLVTGAWASSATLLAKVNNYGYNEIVGDVYRKIGGSKCYDFIENGFEAFDRMIGNNKSAELSKMLGLCTDMGRELSASTFLSYFSQIFGSQLQFQNKDILCQLLANTNATDDLGRIVEVFREIFFISNEICSPISYQLVIDTYKESDMESPNVDFGIRQFVYQECSTLGWFPTTSSRYQPFGSGFSTDLFYNICKDTFENKFDKEVIDRNENIFNNFYGGLEINVTNVIFTQGEQDPFRALGIQKDLNEFSPVFVIPGYPSSQDMLIHLESDTVEMKEVKQHIEHIIAHWVSPK